MVRKELIYFLASMDFVRTTDLKNEGIPFILVPFDVFDRAGTFGSVLIKTDDGFVLEAPYCDFEKGKGCGIAFGYRDYLGKDDLELLVGEIDFNMAAFSDFLKSKPSDSEWGAEELKQELANTAGGSWDLLQLSSRCINFPFSVEDRDYFGQYICLTSSGFLSVPYSSGNSLDKGEEPLLQDIRSLDVSVVLKYVKEYARLKDNLLLFTRGAVLI